MHSLYWRIFVMFWIAIVLILVGTVTVAVNAALNLRDDHPWLQREEIYTQAAQAFETGGVARLSQWLERLDPPELRDRTFILDSTGRDVLGRSTPTPFRNASYSGRDGSAAAPGARAMPIASPIRGSLFLAGPDGKTWRVMIDIGVFRGPVRHFGALGLPGVPATTLVIALVVSAVICFFLARYLTAPIDSLRQATRQIATGDLDVRVSPGLKGRRDDLGLLAADFDAMAERVCKLLESKQQLLRDVSHELRSPLARLQLALSLAERQDPGLGRDLARIGREADRLEQLLARTLQLTRLEYPASSFENVHLDVHELLNQILMDVAIEADARSCRVILEGTEALVLSGDRERLRSAFENVIRNAVRYTQPHSQVTVRALRGASSVEVTVADHGPGVPEKDLALIFEPFYRVNAARDRSEGGEGLGLAIAARAVALHGGSISARNLENGGLAVQIVLPLRNGAAA
jgi:signal transduction histidine kinase